MRQLILTLAFLVLAGPLQAADTITLAPGAETDGSHLRPFYAHYEEVALTEGAPAAGPRRTTRLERIRLRGEDGLRFGITMLGQEATVYDEIQMMASTLEPVMRFVSALTMLHRLEVYDGGEMSGYQVAADGSAAQPLGMSPDGVRFPGGVAALVLAGRELTEGMTIDLPVFSSDMGPEMANLTTRLRVLGQERIDAAGRSWDTWVVEAEQLDGAGEALKMPDGTPMPRSKQWVSADAPYGIRSQWRPGVATQLVAVELLEVR